MNDQYSLLAAWAPVVAGVVTLLLTRLMLVSAIFTRIQDVPNERSLHDTPIPRIGGLALMLGVLTAWHLLKDQTTSWLYSGVIVLLLLSLLDDLRDVAARWRLLGHLVVAAGFVALGMAPMPIYLAIVLVLGVVWVTNLYNFMDGANGLAGGMAVFGFGFYAMTAAALGDIHFALVNLVIVASSLAFLCFNFGKAQVFMGDAGSIPLGYLVAAIGLLGWQRGLWPIWFPVVTFSSFVADATVTLLKRLLRGERVWQAHHEHYYQRVIRMGWSHRRTALVEYGLMMASGVVAMLAVLMPSWGGLVLLCAYLCVKAVLMCWVDRSWKRYA